MSDAEICDPGRPPAITDAIYRYCRSMDRIDVELGYSIWHGCRRGLWRGYLHRQRRGFIDHVCEQHRRRLPFHRSPNHHRAGWRARGRESYVTPRELEASS